MHVGADANRVGNVTGQMQVIRYADVAELEARTADRVLRWPRNATSTDPGTRIGTAKDRGRFTTEGRRAVTTLAAWLENQLP